MYFYLFVYIAINKNMLFSEKESMLLNYHSMIFTYFILMTN